ncbi:ankyrin repeat domain-containing protein [uncultured Roseobacter sp.]|uniref:ankyrin repeat domain-containing protein n=1 Tax=uncultured Roseobacter sp. TaxID=114847 RepID=UPI0026104D87|nr:ankyrin repeat domain-containing protein [uncultured Roseobacter sp.]
MNFELDEFAKIVSLLLDDKTDEEAYQREAGRVAKKARDKFFKGIRPAKKRAELFPGWLDDVSRLEFLGSYSRDLYERARDKFNHNMIGTLSDNKANALHCALLLHFRLHLFVSPEDREFADDLDRQVFGGQTFEDFVGKPVFKFNPDTYFEPPAMAAPMSHPPYISAKEVEYLLNKDINHGVWLNPHNHFSIPLEGRDNEQKRLTQFMLHDAAFRVQPVIAPSGAGKTRLISEWMKPYSPRFNHQTSWEAGFLVSDGNDLARSPEPWKKWDISKNTLIVIDYTHAFDEVVKAIARRAIRRTDGTDHKIRLIVVDHVMPVLLADDFFWRQFSGGHRATMDSFEARYLEQTLVLQSEKDQSDLLRNIIAASASIGNEIVSRNDPVVSDALHHLDRIGHEQGNRDAVRHPLFAALMGRAIRKASGAPDYSTWSRRDLVDQYFESKDRLPWSREMSSDVPSVSSRNSTGLYAGAVVSAATLRRGISRLTIKKYLPVNDEAIIQIAQRVISSDKIHEIGPFLPDILGETFLLKFLAATEERPEVFAVFLSLLANSSVNAQEISRNFRETIDRLARNLAADDPDNPDVLESWQQLLKLLDPNIFEADKPLRTYVSYVIADVITHLDGVVKRMPNREKNGVVLYAEYLALKSQLVQLVDSEELCSKPSQDNLLNWVRTVFKFFECIEFEDSEKYVQQIAVVARVFAQRNSKNWTASILAASEGHLRILKFLLSHTGEDVNHVDTSGVSAVVVACANGHFEVLRHLHMEAGADVHLATNFRSTAAMRAAQNGHLEVLRYLHVEAGADLDMRSLLGHTAMVLAVRNANLQVLRYLHNEGEINIYAVDCYGYNAAMIASLRGHLNILQYLHIEANFDLEAVNYSGTTAAMMAAGDGHLEVLRYLHEEAKVNLSAVDNIGRTVAMRACMTGHFDVVRYLHKEANVDFCAKDYSGRTTVMEACVFGHLEILKYLSKEVEVDFDAADDDGMTAGLIAIRYGHVKVLRKFFNNKISLDVETHQGETAMSIAKENGHRHVVEFLIEQGIN